MEDEALTGQIIGAAIHVHRVVGPGLLESAYELCFGHELVKRGLRIRQQVALPLVYDTLTIEKAYRLDFIVENRVIVEIKSIQRFERIHTAQLITYLTLAQCKVGLLINFNVPYLPEGIKRVVL